MVTGFSTASQKSYGVQETTQPNSFVFGQDWVDNWPYRLNRNFGTSIGDPLFVIKTAVSDSTANTNPWMQFTVNRCAVVRLFFAEPPGPTEPFPNASLRAYTCFAPSTSNGIFDNINNLADIIPAGQCVGIAPVGTVLLPPRRGLPTDSSKMYTVFIQTAKTPSELSNCN
jgi:hypothetical protein